MCDTESTEALRVIIEAMKCTRDHFLSECHGQVGWNLNAEQTLEILEFGKRVLMPWVGIRSSLRAVKGSNDIKLLVGLAVQIENFDATEIEGEEANWQQLVHLVMQGVAARIAEATALPDFSRLSFDALQKIFARLSDGGWSAEQEVHVPVLKTNDPALYKSSPNTMGVELHWKYADFGCNVYPQQASATVQNVVWLGRMKFAFVDLSVTCLAREGENSTSLTRGFATPTQVTAPCWSLLTADLKRFEHGSPQSYKLLFKSRMSKLHKKCLALVRFYAGVKGIAPGQASVEDAWRYFCESGCPELSETLRACLCRGFNPIRRAQPDFFLTLTCSEFGGVISTTTAAEVWREVNALQVLIDWAMHRSKQAGGLRVGDVVLVRPECESAEWREAECTVTKVNGPHVEVQRVGESISNGSVEAGAKEALEVAAVMLYDAGQTAMIQLLKHIKFGAITMNDFGDWLGIGRLLYASNVPVFLELLKRTIEVQTGQSPIEVLGGQGMLRKGQSAAPVADPNKAVCKLLLDILRRSPEHVNKVDTQKEQCSKQITQPSQEVARKPKETTKVDRKSKESTNRRSEIKITTKKILHLTIHNNKKTEQITKLSNENKEQSRQNTNLRDENKQKTKQITKLSNENKQKTEQITQLSNEDKQKSEQITQLNNDIHQRTLQNTQVYNENCQMSQQIEHLQQQNNQKLEELAASMPLDDLRAIVDRRMYSLKRENESGEVDAEMSKRPRMM